MKSPRSLLLMVILFGALLPVSVSATPDFVRHTPNASVYGEAAGVTMREEEVPREDEVVDLWISIGYSGYYTDVAVYYTTDGSEPQGSFGSPGTASTIVLRSSTGSVSFVRSQPYSSTSIDWWKATLPSFTRTYGLTIRYKISGWHSGGGPEVFANNTGCADGTCDDPTAPATLFSYPVRLAWPGAGFPNANPGVGYPSVHLWKEEPVVGNNWINVQLDQNGSVYDIYFPSAGCVQGVGTKNEGYVDGYDTFPPGLPLDCKGQMNMNMACAGLRVDGITYWLTNEGGAYNAVNQSYIPDTNVVRTTQTLARPGTNIDVVQYDFCPKGIAFPTDSSGTPVRGIQIKRIIMTNNGEAAKTVNLYYYTDPAVNGGDSYDVMSFDPTLGAMSVVDQTYRATSSSGEYNPTSFPDYAKNISIDFTSALKLCFTLGGTAGTPAVDSWRDSSPDNSEGWMGLKLTIEPGKSAEVDIITIGGWKQGAGDPGSPRIYAGQIVPALNWFYAASAADLQSTTQDYWTDWLAQGTTIDLPDPRCNSVFKRCLLSTALHIDEKGGGVIAGMHNGAYPFVWPRDAVYAAVTLDRTGHTTEAENVYRFLREVAYRSDEEPGRQGFWYQKYTTDGYRVWTAPQVDETAVVPWGVKYHYDSTGDSGFLSQNYGIVYEAARASSEDSVVDTRLYYDHAAQLMHSNNVWEDSWDDFLYSNASVERGLRDAAAVASKTGDSTNAALFASRADSIHTGILNRLTWDGENTDISQLGLTYPFDCLSADDPRMQHIIDRINGTAADRWGNVHRITNSGGQFDGLINRYWGDGYWNGGPWYLSTLWYGMFYGRSQDCTPGRSDIDVLRNRIDLLINRLAPTGLGAEQVAPSTSLLYPGQADFSLQAAWPNAWESMSTLADAFMLFLDLRPDAGNSRFSIAPKLPTGWTSITYKNIRVGPIAFNVTCSESQYESSEVFTNLTGGSCGFDTSVRIPAGLSPKSVTVNGVPVVYTCVAAVGRVRLSVELSPGAGIETIVRVFFADAPSISAHELKSLPDGSAVYVEDVVVTRVHSDRFNVETPDRAAGFAVVGSGAARGEKVKLFGTVGSSGPERVLYLTSIVEQSDAPLVPRPLGLVGLSAGGSDFGYQQGVTNGAGLNNIGLDVVLSGAIREIAADGSYLVIDDGSTIRDSSGSNGIRIVGSLDSGTFEIDQFVRAAGSLGMYESGGARYPLLRVAETTDIR